ncbi:MAG: class I SAM-dependent methyltransferase [Patescibacteria group bacterium]
MFKNFYNKYIFPKFMNFVMKNREMEKLRPGVVGMAGGVVLEIGFGSGLNLPYYKNVTKLYALEPSAELYNMARGLIEKISFPVEYLNASAEKIPLSNNSIDCAISTWVLCSIPKPEIALKEVFRVLKPGGKLVFIEHGKSPKNFTAKLQKLFTPISKCVAGCHLDREVENLIQDSGFELQKLEKFQPLSKPLAPMYKGVALCKK